MSKFRTTEINENLFPSEGLKFITIKSDNLKGRGDICVYVPKNAEGNNLPIVTLLHGVYGSAWVWALKGGAHISLQEMIDGGEVQNMILAMPSDGLWGDGSGYLEHGGRNYEKWITEDVPTAIIENIPEASNNSPQFIGGLSMGGYGALRLGTKYPDQYKAISAHSAITKFEDLSLFVEEPLTNYQVTSQKDLDVLDCIFSNKDQIPPLRMDCGISDFLLPQNRELNKSLKEHDIPHQYFEFEGGHEWTYWQEHIKDSFRFFNQHIEN